MIPSKEYRRRLPHIQPDQAVFFITFRLIDTIPKAMIESFSFDFEKALQESEKNHKKILEFRQNYFDQVETALDSAEFGPTWLKNDAIAAIVSESLHFYDQKMYKLICYCIMSNHVHLVAYSFQKPLFQVMKSLKTFTANRANKLFGRTGSFWQREYFDRIVRDKNDLDEIIKYTLNNPVKIGLVENWKLWPYSYCHPIYINE